MTALEKFGETEAIILVKAAPVIGLKHGETVCCAGLDLHGNWLRMYPVSFRVLEDTKKFRRWDKVKFSWRRPSEDERIESRHVSSQTLEIIGHMPKRERAGFLDKHIVTSLHAEREKGRSFALLRPRIQKFTAKRRSAAEVAEQQSKIDLFHSQSDLFIARPSLPVVACPYKFIYNYETDDGAREGTCQDWESEATYFRWAREYGESKAIREMERVFGHDLPDRGLYFAMGTHSRYPETWLINGLIQMQPTNQPSLL